jgi:hypothetical protein
MMMNARRSLSLVVLLLSMFYYGRKAGFCEREGVEKSSWWRRIWTRNLGNNNDDNFGWVCLFFRSRLPRENQEDDLFANAWSTTHRIYRKIGECFFVGPHGVACAFDDVGQQRHYSLVLATLVGSRCRRAPWF